MDLRKMKCEGCGEKESSEKFFQCPVCQEEEKKHTTRKEGKMGMYCSQQCFARNWLDHRRVRHSLAQQSERRVLKAAKNETDASLGSTKQKNAKNERTSRGEKEKNSGVPERAKGKANDVEEESDESEEEEVVLCVEPWGVLPSARECEEVGQAVLRPPLSFATTQKAIIACCASVEDVEGDNSGEERCSAQKKPIVEEKESTEEDEAFLTTLWWSAATAAAHFLSGHRRTIGTDGGTPEMSGQHGRMAVVSVVVAGDVLTAHAFAWACRCAGLSGCIRLHVDVASYGGEQEASAALTAANNRSSESLFGFFIVITTEECYKSAESYYGCDASSPLRSCWSSESGGESSGRHLLQSFFSDYSPAVRDEREAKHALYLLVTLPDVSTPEALERSGLPSLFFVGESSDGAPERMTENVQEGEKRSNAASCSAFTHRVSCFPSSRYPWMTKSFWMGAGVEHLEATTAARCGGSKLSVASPSSIVMGSAERDGNAEDSSDDDSSEERVAWEVDDGVSTCLANGDMEGAVEGLLRCYGRYCVVSHTKEAESRACLESGGAEEQGRPRAAGHDRRLWVGGHEERFYRLLVHTWRCNWGALDVSHAHHRFMDCCRALLHHDERFTHQVLSSQTTSALVSSVAGRQGNGGTLALRTGSGGGGTSGRCMSDGVLRAFYATVSTLPRLSASSLVPLSDTSSASTANGSSATTVSTPASRDKRTPGVKTTSDSYAKWKSAVSELLPRTMGEEAQNTPSGLALRDALGVHAAFAEESNKRTIPLNYLRGEYPFLQLQAFLSHIYAFLVGKGAGGAGASGKDSAESSEGVLCSVSGLSLLDALGELWGIDAVVPGCKAVLRVLREKKKTEVMQMVEDGSMSPARSSRNSLNSLHTLQLAAMQRAGDRLERRVGVRFSTAEAAYVTVVMLLVYEMLSGELTPECDTTNRSSSAKKDTSSVSLPLSLSLAEMERRLQWSTTAIGSHVGPLMPFLHSVELYHPCSSAHHHTTDGGDRALQRGDLSCDSSNEGKKVASLSSRMVGRKRAREESQDALILRSPAIESYLQQPVRLPLEGTSEGGGQSKKGKHTVGDTLTLFRRRRAGGPHVPLPLPWIALPAATAGAMRRQRLAALAAEEILSAMPKESHIPMYVGDVGQLIGKWNHFNAKYEGLLGVRLQDFLAAHPEHWKVVGNLVTRRKAGSVGPVRLRYEEIGGKLTDDSDSDEDGRGGRQEGGKKPPFRNGNGKARKEAIDAEKSSKARKKKLRREFNQSRNNRNYKRMDPSARVPGYKKKLVGKIKGRGKKANIRNFKRGTG